MSAHLEWPRTNEAPKGELKSLVNRINIIDNGNESSYTSGGNSCIVESWCRLLRDIRTHKCIQLSVLELSFAFSWIVIYSSLLHSQMTSLPTLVFLRLYSSRSFLSNFLTIRHSSSTSQSRFLTTPSAFEFMLILESLGLI